MSPDEYREAMQVVDGEIRRLYRQWGLAAAELEREDLRQIALIALLRVGEVGSLGRIAIRHDFSDLMRSRSGIRRQHKGLRMGLQPVLQAGHGYAPLEPIRGHEDLSEVELFVHCERQLEKLSRKNPRAMQCVQRFAQGEETARIAGDLGVLRGTVQAHLYCFRRALASEGGHT